MSSYQCIFLKMLAKFIYFPKQTLMIKLYSHAFKGQKPTSYTPMQIKKGASNKKCPLCDDLYPLTNAGTKLKWDKTNSICNCLVYEFMVHTLE